MAEPITVNELTRWLETIERRMGEMHGENKAGLVEIKASVAELARYQRDQNGRVGRHETAIAVLKEQQRTTSEEIDAIKEAATEAATGAASQAIQDTAPGTKRIATLAALAAGGTGGGIVGLAKAIEMLSNLMK